MVVVALFLTVKTWKQPRCPSVGEWISKLWYIQTMEYCLVLNEMNYIAMRRYGGNLNACY